MTASYQARPVFLIGSPRSGASLLALSLGQHGTFFQALETNWFERFALGLQHAYAAGIAPRETSQLDVAGIDIDMFFAHFGEAIDALIQRTSGPAHETDRTRRWIDASQANSRHVFALRRLFPHAQFIHVLRDVSQVVASLTTPDNRQLYKSRYVGMSPEEATEEWHRTVTACVDAERAFGSDVVLRIRRRDLVERPEETIRHCLAFLGESFDLACLRPYRTLDRSVELDPRVSLPVVDGQREVDDAVAALSQDLLDEGTPRYRADEDRIAQLEAAFNRRWMRELPRQVGPGRERASDSALTARRRSAQWNRLPLLRLFDRTSLQALTARERER